jgi:hypothetical protein
MSLLEDPVQLLEFSARDRLRSAALAAFGLRDEAPIGRNDAAILVGDVFPDPAIEALKANPAQLADVKRIVSTAGRNTVRAIQAAVRSEGLVDTRLFISSWRFEMTDVSGSGLGIDLSFINMAPYAKFVHAKGTPASQTFFSTVLPGVLDAAWAALRPLLLVQVPGIVGGIQPVTLDRTIPPVPTLERPLIPMTFQPEAPPRPRAPWVKPPTPAPPPVRPDIPGRVVAPTGTTSITTEGATVTVSPSARPTPTLHKPGLGAGSKSWRIEDPATGIKLDEAPPVLGRTTDLDARQLQWSWVHGSNNKAAVALKIAAQDELNAGGLVYSKVGFRYTAADIAAARSAARWMYEQTQRDLAAKGVRSVRLYRGTAQGDAVNALESWTTDIAVAIKFAKRVGGVVIVEDVPASRILVYHRGPGWKNGAFGDQSEYVLLGE